MGPKIILFSCFAIALRPGYCDLKSSGGDERARLPEFLTELDLASLEASQEDIEAIKTVVKRLAPEKNGVMGQPGVDFPALTTIPVTSFSCRGLKGGYYADLETNCQVFHICDNGRKISFLCPNGTIFQQSQLICDWWFKVDCSKSTELYEQSAEQLAEDERKRSDAKRINSEFHRPNADNDDNNGQNYYQTENSDYDGRQNGRTNPYGDANVKNRISGSPGQKSTDFKASNRHFDPSQIYSSNGLSADRFNQMNDLADGNTLKNSQDDAGASRNVNNYKNPQQQQQQPVQSSGRSIADRGNYRAVDRQQNRLVDTANEDAKRQFNHEPRGAGKFPGSMRNNYNSQQNQPVRSNQRSTDYSSTGRNTPRENERRNFVESSSVGSGISDYEQSSNRATPFYTETTTFRTSTPGPVREYQQLAESAAFASNRGNRFNEPYSSSQFNTYYGKLNDNANNNNNNNNSNSETRVQQQKTTEKPRHKPITPTPGTDRTGGNVVRVRVGQPAASAFPTSQTLHEPRSNDRNSDYATATETSTVAATRPYADDNADDNRGKTWSRDDNIDYATTTARPLNRESQFTTEASNIDVATDNYSGNSLTPGSEQTTATNTDFFENTTPTIISSGTYVNAKAYTSSRERINSHEAFDDSPGFGTSKTYSKSQDDSENSMANGVTTPASFNDVTRDRNSVKSQENFNHQVRGTGESSQKARNLLYGQTQNSINSSTEKSSRSAATLGLNQNGSTGRTLSPYDTSITYQQGKVMSTLGPYVPFTKNYAYSTTTTSTTIKPPVYTATVPTYSSTAASYRSTSAKSLGGKLGASSVRPGGRLASGSGAYLPEKKTDASRYFYKKHGLNERPSEEREHAMSMLQSLRGLEDSVPRIIETANGARSGLNVPTSSGPSTLHSLALYFATAGDDFDATAETRTESESMENRTPEKTKDSENVKGVELPKTILTQHTINSYAELFNLNNALDGANSSTKTVLDIGLDVSNEDNDDLDLQQSQGPIDGARESNGTRLRELAQVFTHALSAYLQDPDTFKKILTEIRPTEPSTRSYNDDGFSGTTTLASTTLDDYPSVTKDKDEVLDFSDDSAPLRNRGPTIYPMTTTDLPVTTDYYKYYTTPNENSNDSNDEDNFAFQVNHAFGINAKFNEPSSSGNDGVYYTDEDNGPKGTTALDGSTNDDPLNDYTDNYFPTGESDNKIGGFRNNTRSAGTYQPYGKHVRPFDATPINDNYVSSSTPSTYVGASESRANRLEPASNRNNDKVSNNLDASIKTHRTGPTKKLANSMRSDDAKKPQRSTTESFRIRYYDPTTESPKSDDRESLITAGSVYSNYRETDNDFARHDETTKNFAPTTRQSYANEDATTKRYDEKTTAFTDKDRRKDRKFNDHWTSSPAVTQLWESTVFVDPERINQGLVSGEDLDSNSEISTLDYYEATVNPSASYSANGTNERNNAESLVTGATNSGLSSRDNNNADYSSSPWKWDAGALSENNDSPTAFTLLPKATYSTSERNVATAAPSPIYTTRSSITTTITSSVTSTSSSAGSSAIPDPPQPQIQRNIPSGPKNGIGENGRDNEAARAQEMFGKLNSTSSNTLMRVMKQADDNATVRQLVLLLINHCNGPMNKTMEEEKQQLLDALLRMPVNEFTSEESRELVSGINRINLPIGKKDFPKESTSTIATSTTDEPVITTFRSKKGRRFKSNDREKLRSGDNGKKEDIAGVDKNAESNALTSEDTSTSDARALELLRSLYTVAAKWG